MAESLHLPEPGAPPPATPALLWRWLVTQWRRAFHVNASRLDAFLFVGGEFPCAQWPAVHALGVRAVLSLQGEREDVFCDPLPARSLRLAVEDFHPPSIAQLEAAVAFLRQARADDLPTLIHCHAGVGRAPLTAAAYLIAEGMTLAAATHYVYTARPIMYLNARQRARLAEWEQHLRLPRQTPSQAADPSVPGRAG